MVSSWIQHTRYTSRVQSPHYLYPFVECDVHAGPQRSYLVCEHVAKDGEPPALIVPAGIDEPGQILCDRDHGDFSTCMLLCAPHCEAWLSTLPRWKP
jgi:hypothetical protein